MTETTKQRLGLLLRLLLSIGLMVLLLSQINLTALIQDFQRVDPTLYLLGLLLFGLSLIAWARRWHLFLRGAGETVTLGATFSTLLIGLFMSLLLPALVGMDVGRMSEMARMRENKIGVVSTVLLDRLIGLISLVITALFALIIAGYQYVGSEVILVVVVCAVVLGALWVLFFNRRFMRLFSGLLELPVIRRFAGLARDLYRALLQLQHQRGLLVAAFLTSMALTVIEICSVIVLSRALGSTTDLVYFFIFMPIIWLVLALPISIGGLGVREATFVSFFSQVGMTPSQAILLSLLYYTFALITGGFGGLIWIRAAALSMLTNKDRAAA